MFCKKGVYRNFVKCTGKYLCQSLFFKWSCRLESCGFIKKRLWHRCFPVNFAKFLRTPFLTEQLRWLLLHKNFENVWIDIWYFFMLFRKVKFLRGCVWVETMGFSFLIWYVLFIYSFSFYRQYWSWYNMNSALNGRPKIIPNTEQNNEQTQIKPMEIFQYLMTFLTI